MRGGGQTPQKIQTKGDVMKKPQLNAAEVAKELGLKLSHTQELKIQKLLNDIYAKANPPKERVLQIILQIYLSDKSLSCLDDIYVISYGSNHVAIEYKYSFWPKKLTELGVFKTVDAYVVRESEPFEIEIDNGKTSIKHKQNPFATDKPIIGAYARGVRPDGEVVIATANLNELKAAAKASKVKAKGKSTIWDVWFEEVSKKVPLKRLVKLISIPSEIQTALDIDNSNYAKPEEIQEVEKAEDAIDAMEELNETKELPTLQEVLDVNKIEYEFKKGYVKVKEEDINKLQDKDILKKYLTPFAKEPGYMVGKASTKIEELTVDSSSGETEIEYVPVEENEK